MKLNIGSLEKRIPGFKNLDVVPGNGVDIVADARKIPLDDCSVEEIYASHVLEHFGRTETLAVLKEWYRVLEYNGKLYVAVPNWEAAVELYASGSGLGEWLVEFLYGQQNNEFYHHRTVFDHGRLVRFLRQAGFTEFERVPFFGLLETDCSNLVTEFNGRKILVSLNIIATKGHK